MYNVYFPDVEEKVSTVDAVVTIKDMDYSDELADENSLEYYDFTIQFCNEVHIFACTL